MNTQIRKCNCGCGENVAGKANYRPGHDARHAGQVGRALVADERDAVARRAFDRMTPGLQAKVEKYVRTHTTTQPADDSVGEVKIGRWWYPARKLDNGTSERNTARDGSGEWVKVHSSAYRPVA